MGKKKIAFLCLIFLLSSQFVFSDDLNKNSAVPGNEPKSSFFKNLFEDDWEILTSPFRIKGKHLLSWGSLALLTAVLIRNDRELYRQTKNYREKKAWISDVSAQVRKLGDGTINLGIAGCFYVGGVFFKNKKAKKTAELSLMSLIHAGVVVQLIKHLSGRKRPEAAPVGEDHWEGPAGFLERYKDHRDMYYDAFPSGHTITAWSIATVIARMYNKSVVVPVLCYSLATLAGLSNVTEDKHWYSDVLVGAAFGYAIGHFVVKKRWKKINLLPFAGYNKFGFSINYAFN